MQEKSQMGCHCIDSLFGKDHRMLLLRRREPGETDSPPSSRKGNQSAELKPASEGKPLKKSLKKRAGSHVQPHSQLSLPSPPEAALLQQAAKVSHSAVEEGFRPALQQSRTDHSPIYSLEPTPQQSHILDHAPPSTRHKHSLGLNSQKNHHFSQPAIFPQNHFPSPPSTPHMAQNKEGGQSREQGFQFEPHSHLNQLHFRQAQTISSAQLPSPSAPNITPHSFRKVENFHGIREGHSQRRVHEESMMIEEFDNLFKDMEKHPTHNIHHDGRPHLRVKQGQKVRRVQRQQLVGRMAESDDDSCSQSVLSEVIGKGFDMTSLQMQRIDKVYRFDETLASHSTRTKLSEVHKVPHDHGEELPRTRFGSIPHFQSYGWL